MNLPRSCSLLSQMQTDRDLVSLILEVLKEGKSKEEQNQIDRMMEMTKNVFRKHFK